ncbi:MAG: tRNA(Met) cytidine acetyltransferase [Gammaproteobacteria bacterium]|jgi:tRNA(Met) cytidine acetyltransferase
MPNTHPHRRFIVFSGQRTWCNTRVKELLMPIEEANQIWIGEGGVAHKQVSKLLGQEFDAVIYDAFSGLDLNVFAAVCGSIVAGGALILLCPDFEEWPTFNDPLNDRWAPYPLSGTDLTGLTQARWAQILRNTPTVEHLSAETNMVVEPIISQRVESDQNLPLTEHQSTAIKAVVRVVTGQRKRPAVITADRGRGKSAALGMAIAQLAKAELVNHVAVVGGQNQSLDTLFKHLRASLELDVSDETTIHYQNINIERITIDELLSSSLQYCLVVVDEAATIGLPRLSSLLQTYSRVAFATTVQGYEGSGRGFHLKLKTALKQHSRGARFTQLTQAIRWSENDPLEALGETLLLLNGELPALDDELSPDVNYSKVRPQALLEDEASLTGVMSLLVAAHYQTTPNDVRYLLDGPKHQLYLQKHGEHITGVIWINMEGGFDADTAQAICLGQRRPRGHLVAEALAAHMGLTSAAQSNIARVQRIAVHPDLQRKGCGSAFLAYVENDLANSCDLIASSFGADTEVLPFWRHSSYSLVRVSDKQNAASGQYSAIVLKALNTLGGVLISEATQAFSTQFVAQLSASLSNLDWPLVRVLLSSYSPTNNLTLSKSQIRDLQYFANGARPYESTLSALRALSLFALNSGDAELGVFISKVAQSQSWERVSEQFGMLGRKSVENKLREQTNKLLQMQTKP